MELIPLEKKKDPIKATAEYILARIGTSKVSIKQLNHYLNGQGLCVVQLYSLLDECIQLHETLEKKFIQAMQMVGEAGH